MRGAPRREVKRKTCEPTGKVQYRSKAKATQAARGLRAHFSREKPSYRAYLCRYCPGWHLTTQPDKRAYDEPSPTIEEEPGDADP